MISEILLHDSRIFATRFQETFPVIHEKAGKKKILLIFQLPYNQYPFEEQKQEEAWNRLKRDIASSAQTIHDIDTGKARGYSRALFVSSILNKVSTYAGKGEVEIVQKAVDFITDFNAQCKKPVITPRNRFFQLPEMARQARLKLQEIRERENRELKFEGGTLVWNYEADRLQILFDSIPDDQRRKELKSYGFKWSPRYQAWQRQLTQNAVYAVKRVLNLQNL